jgi:hypothetical protein
MKTKLLVVLVATLYLCIPNSYGKKYVIPKHSITVTKWDSTLQVLQIAVQNPSDSDINIKWAIVKNEFFSSGWTYNYCDLSQCYVDPSTTPFTATNFLGSKESGAFSVTVSHFNNLSKTASMVVALWDVKDPSNTDTIIMTINATKLGIANVNLNPESISIFPNPAKDYLKVSVSANNFTPCKALIYNTTGQLIYQQVISAGTESIPVFDLPKGIYILNLRDLSGRESKQQFIRE